MPVERIVLPPITSSMSFKGSPSQIPIHEIQQRIQSISSMMAPLKDISTNTAVQVNSSKKPAANASRKRKSDAADKENVDAPAVKKAKQSPDAKQSSTAAKAKASTSSSSSKKAPTKKEQDAAELAKYDVSDVKLDGEENGAVPVYDTCSDIRTKINNHTRMAPKKLSSQAAFIRELTKCVPDGASTEGLSTRALPTFMKKKGSNGGASHAIFYASYVYFEKLRVKQNKSKSKKRQEMEEHWGNKGMDLNMDADRPMFMGPNEFVDINKYGRMNIVRAR